MNILVVEDDPLLRHHLDYQLNEKNCRTCSTAEAETALHMAKEYLPEVGIIDLGLPDMDGLELIRQLRKNDHTFPVLILTARSNWRDKVEGLEAGADDYLVKPFQFEELMARLQALVRRSSGFSSPTVEAKPFRLDLSCKQAWADDKQIELTAYEYKLLEYLMRYHQQVISKNRLAEQLHYDTDRDSNVVEVLVARLRKKLEKASNVNPIQTVRGQGLPVQSPLYMNSLKTRLLLTTAVVLILFYPDHRICHHSGF